MLLLFGLFSEALQLSGVTSFPESRWWSVGAAKLSGEDLNYLGVAGFRIAGGQGILIIAVCQVLPLPTQVLAPQTAHWGACLIPACAQGRFLMRQARKFWNTLSSPVLSPLPPPPPYSHTAPSYQVRCKIQWEGTFLGCP